MSLTELERTAAIRARLHRWRWHPETMVREEFGVEPDAWQLEALRLFPHNQRLALKACKGPGKTAVLAWFVLNFLATRRFSKIGCTSITGGNLDTNLWPEIEKWRLVSPFCRATFTWTASRVFHKAYPEIWFASARSWPKQANAEQQADALAGLHGDYAMWILDESGGMPQSVMVAAEAVLASGIEVKVVQAGNPTHTTGPLYRACTVDRALWKVVTITGDPTDPQRSPRISIKWAQEQIDSYGRENPWVMVNVLGQFPPASINALLGVEEVNRAMARHMPKEAYAWGQKRIGVDVARFGDDRTVIFPRQGIAAFRPIIMRVQNTISIAARVAKAFNDWSAELILIDDSGHWGHGCVDSLTTGGYPVLPILGEDTAIDPRYKNRRAEMWLEMAKWVRAGGALPNIPEMVPELTEPTYTFLGGKFVLEDKKQIKARLGWSPDLADGLSETFAIPDQPGRLMEQLRGRQQTITAYDPYAEPGEGHDQAVTDFNPFEYRE